MPFGDRFLDILNIVNKLKEQRGAGLVGIICAALAGISLKVAAHFLPFLNSIEIYTLVVIAAAGSGIYFARVKDKRDDLFLESDMYIARLREERERMIEEHGKTPSHLRSPDDVIRERLAKLDEAILAETIAKPQRRSSRNSGGPPEVGGPPERPRLGGPQPPPSVP